MYRTTIFVFAFAAIFLMSSPGAASPPDLETLLGPQNWVFESFDKDGGLPVDSVASVLQTRDGYLWLATFDGLVRFDGDRFTVFNTTSTPELGTNRLILLSEAPDGSLWILTETQRLIRHADGVFEELFPPDETLRLLAEAASAPQKASSRRGPEGKMWGISGEGLTVDGRTVIANDHLSAFDFDDSGSLWTATGREGLFALHPTRVRRLGAEHGLPSTIVATLAFDDDASLLVTGSNQVARVDGADIERLQCDFPVYLTYRDPLSGRLLGGDDQGLIELQDDGCVRLDATGILRAVHRTRTGRLVVAATDELFISEPGADPAEETIWTTAFDLDGRSLPWVRTILEDRAGDLWLGTRGGGMARYREQSGLRRFTTADGLPSNHVRGFHQDSDGGLWIATEDAGVAHLDPAAIDSGKLEIGAVDTRDGLFDDSLHTILEDARGWFWISTNRGIFRVRRSDLEARMAGETASVESVVYGEGDGMAHREGNGGAQHSAVQGPEGRLYFSTQDGVVIVDPAELTEDLPEPKIYIEQVFIEDRGASPADGKIVLNSDERSFRIAYTAIALRGAEQVRFRYFLEGYDDLWHEAGDRRMAHYTGVGPGNYHFRVQARSPDGVWGEVSSPLELTIEPYFHETSWFRSLVAAVLLLLFASMIRLRENRQRLRRRQLEALIAARTSELQKERDTVADQKERLVALDRAKSQIFANLSHEFRTPLTLILGPVQDMLTGLYGPLDAEMSRELERIEANSSRLLSLVGQLLDLARLDARGLDLRVKEGDLGEFVGSMVHRFTSLAERRRIQLTMEKSSFPTCVYFDSEQLDKVVANLLSNAFKFTPTGGRVSVLVQSDAREAKITVSDTGRGMDQDDVAQIFTRFFRAESVAQHQIPGTGLGLALARDLVQLHGGEIEVSSRLGEGSAFTVRLPLGREHFREEQILTEDFRAVDRPGDVSSAALIERANDALLPELEGAAERWPEESADEHDERPVVLVIDDHPDLRAYVKRHLETDYRVVEGVDGVAGLETAREQLPDLIVSDVMMPRMDGFELLREVRRDPELEWLPVVLLTARAEAEDRLTGLDIGADEYLTKPFDARELKARIDNLIAQRRRLRECFLEKGAAEPKPIQIVEEARRACSEEVFLDRVFAAIDENLTDESFNVDLLSARLAMSRAQLYRKLEPLTDMRPAAMILERRLELSTKMLDAAELGVSEVAYAVGFKSVAHFSARFRDRFGVTPTAWRRQAA